MKKFFAFAAFLYISSSVLASEVSNRKTEVLVKNDCTGGFVAVIHTSVFSVTGHLRGVAKGETVSFGHLTANLFGYVEVSNLWVSNTDVAPLRTSIDACKKITFVFDHRHFLRFCAPNPSRIICEH